jgi:hypothetical protein
VCQQNECSAPFKETLRSIPEVHDISDTSSTSAVDSAMSPNSTLRTEISSDDEIMADQTSIQPHSAKVGVPGDLPLAGIRPPSPTRVTLNSFDDTYVLEDGGPLLTFLRVVDPGFAYEPASTVLKLWPQFADSSADVTWSMLSEVGKVADFLRAARLYADAFDLYYMVFCHLHKTLDTYIRRHLLTIVLNCARASLTDQQDQCAVAVLRLALRDQERGAGDHISAGVLHLYLGELYKKQRDGKSEVSTMTAIQYLAEACYGEDKQDPYFGPVRARTVVELDFPKPLHTSLILHNKMIPPAYAPYFTTDLESPAVQLACDIKSHMVSKYLLKWCADVITNKARCINPLASILTGDTPTVRECIARLLFCCCFETWLKGTRTAIGGGRYFSEVKSALKNLKMPWRESLSAISFVIVDEAFRDFDPLPAMKKRFTPKSLASHLARTIKSMLCRVTETEETFTDTFLAFLVAPGNDRTPSQVDELSQRVLQVFAGNIISSGILREQQRNRSSTPEWKELVPVAADLQGYVVSQSPISRMLYTPRSSFSSGARSLRALHAEREHVSVGSLSTSNSKGSLTPWSQSRRSSWSFELVTGLTPDSSLHVREGDTNDGLGISPEKLDDSVMVDI